MDYKGLNDLVTDTDHRAEETIKNTLLASFPDHAILAEESGSTTTESDCLWVIDPLDGTTNFVHGYPSFAVSIGLLIQHEPQVGVIVELPANNVYTAVRGEGAFRNEVPIRVSTTEKLNQALLVTGFGYEHDAAWQANLDLFREFTDLTQGIRRLGAAAVDLCHLACGQVDGFWEFGLQPWDMAAGVLIVSAAGGRVSTMDGEKFSLYGRNILASNGRLHAEMLTRTKAALEGLQNF